MFNRDFFLAVFLGSLVLVFQGCGGDNEPTPVIQDTLTLYSGQQMEPSHLAPFWPYYNGVMPMSITFKAGNKDVFIKGMKIKNIGDVLKGYNALWVIDEYSNWLTRIGVQPSEDGNFYDVKFDTPLVVKMFATRMVHIGFYHESPLDGEIQLEVDTKDPNDVDSSADAELGGATSEAHQIDGFADGGVLTKG